MGMKRIVLGLVVLYFAFMPVYSQEIDISSVFVAQNGVFTYHIPDDEEPIQNNTQEEIDVSQDIVSDDITADTSGLPKYNPEDYMYADKDYDIDDMYNFVLHGYAEYFDNENNTVVLDLSEADFLALNIKKPDSIEAKYFGYLRPSPSLFDNYYTKYNGSEYSIAPISGSSSKTVGGFSAGATYSQGIDYGELEQSSGVFSKYQYKNFAISTAYAKTVNTTNNNYNDTFYLTPELRLNQYLAIKNILSADTVKKRKKAEIVLSVNPFGNRDIDRLRLEFGASETYDEINNTLKNQFKFSTNYRF